MTPADARNVDGQVRLRAFQLHGLQGFHGAQVSVPSREGHRPNREFLAERYELFKKAS